MNQNEPHGPVQHCWCKHRQAEEVVSEPGCARCERGEREGMECGEVSGGERAKGMRNHVQREGVEERE